MAIQTLTSTTSRRYGWRAFARSICAPLRRLLAARVTSAVITIAARATTRAIATAAPSPSQDFHSNIRVLLQFLRFTLPSKSAQLDVRRHKHYGVARDKLVELEHAPGIVAARERQDVLLRR